MTPPATTNTKREERTVIRGLEDVNGIVNYGPHKDVCEEPCKGRTKAVERFSTLWEARVESSFRSDGRSEGRCQGNYNKEDQAPNGGQTQNTRNNASRHRRPCPSVSQALRVLDDTLRLVLHVVSIRPLQRSCC
jgi:hypothetical protein